MHRATPRHWSPRATRSTRWARSDLARGAYRSAIAIDPASVDALVGLGRTLVRSDPKAAEAAFLDAATRQPDNVTALSNLGIARDMQGRHDAAQVAYRQALAVAPDSTDVKLNLGLSLALSGKPAEAVAMLRPLTGEADATGLRRNDLAAALSLAGDRAEAERVMRGEVSAGGCRCLADGHCIRRYAARRYRVPGPRCACCRGGIHAVVGGRRGIPAATVGGRGGGLPAVGG